MLVVVPTLLNRNVGSHHMVPIATVPERWMVVMGMSGFFLVVAAHLHDGDAGFESAC